MEGLILRIGRALEPQLLCDRGCCEYMIPGYHLDPDSGRVAFGHCRDRLGAGRVDQADQATDLA
jgi:hypothetical protein